MRRPEGHRWQVFKRLVRARYGDICHICGHSGARQADHLDPVADRPDLAWKLENVRPAHGSPGNRCFQCEPVKGIACNQLRGGYSVERARRLIAERTRGGPAPPVPEIRPPVSGPPPGREW